jgi:hypothetical protein
MLGLPLASVGAIGATAGVSPAPAPEAAAADGGATFGTDADAGGVVIAGPAEASALGALGGVGAVIAGAAGAVGEFTTTAEAPRPDAAPAGCAAISRVSDTGRVDGGRARAGAAMGALAAMGGAVDAGDCGGVGGIVMATAGRGASKLAGGAVVAAGAELGGSVALAEPAGPFAAKTGEGMAVARTLVTMARAASGVFSGSAGRSTSEKTTPAPAIAPIAVATRTTRAVRAKLGAGAK